MANTGDVAPQELKAAISKHLKLHLVAYGLEAWSPKSHYSLHLGIQLERHSILPSCFLMERKHRHLKRFATGRQTLVAYEAGLMEEVVVQHLYDLHTPTGKSGLYEPHGAPDCVVQALRSILHLLPTTKVQSARRVCVRHRRVQVGDVVAFDSLRTNCIHFGKVVFHCAVDGICFTCLSQWAVQEVHEHFVSCLVENEEAVLVRSDSIIEPCVHSGGSPGCAASVILPLRVRNKAKPE